MPKKKNKEDLARTRHISIRLNNKEDCLIWDNFVSDIKVNNVGKNHSERRIINSILSELILDFIKNKKINNYKSEISAVIQPYINKAVKDSMRLALLALIKNQNDLKKEVYQLAQMLSMILRMLASIPKTDGKPLFDSSKIESGETTTKELLSWLKDFSTKEEKI